MPSGTPAAPPGRAGAASTRTAHDLAHIFDSEQLARHRITPGSWRPVLAVTDREFWDGIDPATRAGLIAAAERRCTGPWPALPATLWLDYHRTGNRLHYEDPYFGRRDRLAAAVLAACLTDEPRWHDEVLDGVWLLLEETTWCIPPHEGYQAGLLPDPDRPMLDLFAAETGSVLAWTYAVLGERLAELSPTVPARLVAEVKRRILVPQRTIDDWVWFGRKVPHVNNWNPWINSNVLACSLLLDHDEADIRTTVERVVEGLDVFLRDYPDDGGCDEGAVYWWRAGASLSECLEFLRECTGLDGYGLPVVGEIARYLYRVHIEGDWYVNVADGSAQLDRLNAAAHLVWRLGQRIDDAILSAHGRSIRGAGPVVETGAELGRSLGRTLLALADDGWRAAPATPAPRVRQSYLPDTQVLVARQRAGTADGLLVSVKGGHNGEGHNHNDVGTVLVALDGHPVLVDAGVAHYTQKHFGPQRYEIWTLRSDFHNVPSVDGIEQAPGRDFAARDLAAALADPSAALSLDIAGAYPAAAGIRRWQRRVELDRAAEEVRLTDEWELDHDPATVVLHLLASAEPSVHASGGTVPTVDDAGRTVPSVSAAGRTVPGADADIRTVPGADADIRTVPGADADIRTVPGADADIRTVPGADTLTVPTPTRPLLIELSAGLRAEVERIDLDDRRLHAVWGESLWRITVAQRTPTRTGSWTLRMRAG